MKQLQIYWFKVAEKITLTKDEMNEKLSTLNNDLRVQGKGTKTMYNYWKKNGSFNIERKGNYVSLYIRENNKFKIYSTNTFDNNKNLEECTGTKAIQALEAKFKELNNVGLKVAFGTTEEEIKGCIPKQFYYINRTKINKIIDGVSAVDFSSHYPSNGCGLLPDSHTAKVCPGTVEPDSEYKFAFYTKSGHLAVYNEFDTHDWIDINNIFLGYMFDSNKHVSIDPEDDETILMKESKYQLTDVWKYFYEQRKADPVNKLVLNASIGYFHTRSYTRRKYAHLAAVIIGRANDKMYKLAKKIGFNKILHICVDGCIYKSTESFGYGEGLGSLKQEQLNKSVYIKGTNQYVFSELKQYDNCIEVKHGGFDAKTDGSNLETCKNITDIDLYYKKPEIQVN